MCRDCGCIEGVTPLIDGKAPETHHEHGHDHSHGHHHDKPAGQEFSLKKAILGRNDHQAAHNREHFQSEGIFACNWISAPGSGKTRLLEALIEENWLRLPLYVLDGDQATQNDADRIKKAGAPVVQINTGSACHLDAQMVHLGLHKLNPTPNSVVMIENVGNMVCPTAFDLGEAVKIALVSATEGDDKPAKYPDLILTADLLVINKIDLIPYLDFDLDACLASVRKLKPNLPVFAVSAKTGEGLEALANWLQKEAIQAQRHQEAV